MQSIPSVSALLVQRKDISQTSKEIGTWESCRVILTGQILYAYYIYDFTLTVPFIIKNVKHRSSYWVSPHCHRGHRKA